jgi:hypothetical protein
VERQRDTAVKFMFARAGAAVGSIQHYAVPMYCSSTSTALRVTTALRRHWPGFGLAEPHGRWARHWPGRSVLPPHCRMQRRCPARGESSRHIINRKGKPG